MGANELRHSTGRGTRASTSHASTDFPMKEPQELLDMGGLGPKESQGMLARGQGSEIERELFEAGEEVRQVTLEWIRTEAKAPREMDAARRLDGGIPSPKLQGGGLSDVSRVDFDCMGTLDDRNFASSAGASQKKRKAVIRKESVETQDYVSCQGGRQQELEGAWFRPKCGGRTSSSQAHVRPGVRRKGLEVLGACSHRDG